VVNSEPVIERKAARTLLIAERSVLLIQGCDPARLELGTWWLTPGGGIETGESLEAAAAREVLEETGLALDSARFGPVVATRTAEFDFDGAHYRQREWFVAVAVERFEPGSGGWDAVEQRALLEHRWWTIEALEQTDELVYPNELASVLRTLLAGGADGPIELTGS
jgi:8-oxo-dGTP pyrophosphatase MutT (NUDIX family)